ncbi:MAG TPA: CAP domain-containing protein [Burkholderiaceae bacterium]|mgnify:CR=1 FL=1|nr:CAP domain-containing protein [Burkholderiaceae bacterium]
MAFASGSSRISDGAPQLQRDGVSPGGLIAALAAALVHAGALAGDLNPVDSAEQIARYRINDTRCASTPSRTLIGARQRQPHAAVDTPPAAPEAQPLAWNSTLTTVAEQYAQAMADEGYFAHVAPDGTTLAQRVDRAAYQWRAIAANLAVGYATLDETLRAWAHSPRHCHNLIDGRYSEFGIARVHSTRPTNRYAVYWVLVLGQPAGSVGSAVIATSSRPR